MQPIFGRAGLVSIACFRLFPLSQPWLKPIVGSVVLPVLGAVPDGMMVLFSGLGPGAQDQVAVGVGTLAGSTIMLLTIPWFCAVLVGRVDILPNGMPNYKRPLNEDPATWDKLSPEKSFSLFDTGVGVGAEIRTNAKFMLLTCVSYFVILLPAMSVDKQDKMGMPYEQFFKSTSFNNMRLRK